MWTVLDWIFQIAIILFTFCFGVIVGRDSKQEKK